MNLGDRLKAAIKAWGGGGVRAFQRAMQVRCKERGIRGYSLPALYRYIGNVTQPSLDWLRVAADILRVRVEWLASGQGEMTAPEQIITYRPVVTTDRFGEATVPILGSGSGGVEAAIRELVQRLLAACPDSGSEAPDMDSMVRLAEGVQRLALLPLELFDPDFRSKKGAAEEAEERFGPDKELAPHELRLKRRRASRWGPQERHADYLLATLHALMLAVPNRRSGRSFDDLAQTLDAFTAVF